MRADSDIFEYCIDVPDGLLADLNTRLKMTRFPDYLEGSGWEIGVDTRYVTELVEYWQSEFDWRAYEEKLNRLPNYTTTVDGQLIHFIHVRSAREDALPLLLVHGWPGSVIEFLGVIDLLVNPADGLEAFHLVIPSLPGYGFSGPTTEPGWNIARTAEAFAELMQRLGYERYGAQGGDWGAFITTRLAAVYPERVIGLHTNLPAAPVLEEPGELSEVELRQLEQTEKNSVFGTGYAVIQGTRPQTIGLLLNDSPAGLLGWIVEKFRGWSDCDGDVESVFSRDDLVANVMIYWVTQTATSSARMYYENFLPGMALPDGLSKVTVPTGVARFPKEIVLLPRAWLEKRYNIVHWTEMDRGGHFAAMEQPALFAEDVSKFFGEHL